MGKLFGTDGVRGQANSDLSVELALALGRAGGSVLGRAGRARVLVGRDTRASGEMLEAALCAGFCASGLDVVRLGVIPTPGVAALTRALGAAAGGVVTASHNPADQNGIKFFGPDGCKLPDAAEEAIEAAVADSARLPAPVGAGVGRMQDRPDLIHRYAEEVRETISGRLTGLRIVLDCAHGATSAPAPALLADLGAEVEALNCQPNGLNINDGCGSLHPEGMMARVQQSGATLGAALDGDGDRVILCDERARQVDGDHVMALCALAWAGTSRLPGNVVVGTVMSNMGLELALRSAGIRLLRAPVGDRYVAEEMARSGAALGGEKSGHLIFSAHSPTGDGMLSLLQVLEVVRSTGRPLSELADQMTELPQILVNVRVARKDGWEQVPEIAAAAAAATAALAGRGRLLVRPSGTEKLIRVMAEGPDRAELHGWVELIRAAVASSLGAPGDSLL